MKCKGFAMKRTIVITILCVLTAEAAVTPLPGTGPLEWKEEDLSERLMDGAHLFVERQIRQSREERARFWKGKSSFNENRKRLQEIIGAVDSRLPAGMERFGDDANPALVAETSRYRVFQVRCVGPYWTGCSARACSSSQRRRR